MKDETFKRYFLNFWIMIYPTHIKFMLWFLGVVYVLLNKIFLSCFHSDLHFFYFFLFNHVCLIFFPTTSRGLNLPSNLLKPDKALWSH